MCRRDAITRHRSRGFTLLELVVVIVIISILLVVAAKRLFPYLDEAERVAVLTVESQLKNTLVMEAAQRLVRGEAASIAELEHINPMSLLLEAPGNYAGQGYLEKAELPERRWYFNESTKRLVYKLGEPHSEAYRVHSFEDPEFEVRVFFEDRDANGIFDATSDELYGVRLLRIAGANWLAQGTQY